jgi:uncharacterized protein (DUF2141 family)
MKPLFSLGIATGLIVQAFTALAGELRLEVEGLRSAKGSVLIGLYDSKHSFDRAIELSGSDGFLNDPERVAGVALRARTALESGVAFTHLEPGRYAVILLHDEDGDGRLDKNFWGVPTEPYAFSNGAQGFLGPPGFEDAAIELDGADMSITVALVHHGGGLVSLTPGYLEEDAAATPAPPLGASRAVAGAR